MSMRDEFRIFLCHHLGLPLKFYLNTRIQLHLFEIYLILRSKHVQVLIIKKNK